MSLKPDDLPSDLASAQAALLIEREALRAEREARLRVEAERDATVAKVTRIQAEAINWQAEAANARAELSDNEALIAHLELRIEKLKRELYGPRSERTARLIEQLELELEELVTTASEDELAARTAAAKTQAVRAFTRKRPVRKLDPGIESIYVVASPHYSFLSSTGVKAHLAPISMETRGVVAQYWPGEKALGRGA